MREPRMIDAYALADKVFDSKNDNHHTDGIVRKTHNHEHERFLRMIALAPTIDAVPVIRCQNCKHYNLQALACTHDNFNGWIGMDGFCSYGERKE